MSFLAAVEEILLQIRRLLHQQIVYAMLIIGCRSVIDAHRRLSHELLLLLRLKPADLKLLLRVLREDGLLLLGRRLRCSKLCGRLLLHLKLICRLIEIIKVIIWNIIEIIRLHRLSLM